MTGKRMYIWLLITMLLFSATGVFAQGGAEVHCGALPEADCAILKQSQVAMTEVSSVAYDVGFDLSFAGMEDEFGVDPLEIGVDANGQIAMDPELAAGMAPMGPEAMAEMMAKMPDVLVELMRGVAGTLNVNLDLPDVLLAEMGDVPELAFSLVMVDGVVYLDISPFMEPSESGAEMPSWMGIDAASLLETGYGEMMAENELSEMLEMQMEMNREVMSKVQELDQLEDYVLVTREADDEADGVAVAVFKTTMDYAGMFSDETFQAWIGDLINQMIEAQGESAEDLPENFGEIMGALMAGLELEVVEQIGLEDYYTRSLTVDMAFDIDFEALAALAPEDEDLSDMPENFSISMKLNVNLSKFNEAVEVTAPEGAQVIDPMMFLGAEMGE